MRGKNFAGKGWLVMGAILIFLGVFIAAFGYFGASTSGFYSTHEAISYLGLGTPIAIQGVVCLIIGGVIHFLHRKFGDTDDDGIKNDGLPATKAQRKEISQIMQDEGIFFNAESEKLTQGEARRIIRENKEKDK